MFWYFKVATQRDISDPIVLFPVQTLTVSIATLRRAPARVVNRGTEDTLVNYVSGISYNIFFYYEHLSI